MIYGERVRLRRIERADLPHLVEWLNDPEIRRHLAFVYPLSLTEEDDWYAATLKLEPAARPFAIEARVGASAAEEWTLLGSTGYHAIDWRQRSGEPGIFVGRKDVWGRGFGTDAFRALVRWGVDELNLNRIWVRVYEDNVRAIRCYEKIGFRLEGRLRQDRYEGGRYLDTLVMGLLRSELGS